MEIRSKANDPIRLDEIMEIVAGVGDEHYAGNLAIERYARQKSPRSVQIRIIVNSSRDPGARRSWSGRRTISACWHAHRDVYRAILTAHPAATIATAMATYRGIEGFEQTYPGTAYKNIGSMMQPAYMPELCDCPYAPEPTIPRQEPEPEPESRPQRTGYRSAPSRFDFSPTYTLDPAPPPPPRRIEVKVGDTVRHNDGGWTGVVTDIIPNDKGPRTLAVKEPDGWSGDWFEDVFTVEKGQS